MAVWSSLWKCAFGHVGDKRGVPRKFLVNGGSRRLIWRSSLLVLGPGYSVRERCLSFQ